MSEKNLDQSKIVVPKIPVSEVGSVRYFRRLSPDKRNKLLRDLSNKGIVPGLETPDSYFVNEEDQNPEGFEVLTTTPAISLNGSGKLVKK